MAEDLMVDRYRYESLLERESRYDMASEILESDLYGGDKLKVLEMIFGIVREEEKEDEKLRNLKLGNYNAESNNFRIDEELMITITLNEYRELVTVSATKDLLVKQAESDKYTREQENRALKEQNEKLKSENYDLLQKLQEIQEKSSKNREDDYDTV